MIDLTYAIRRENEFGAVRDCLAVESRQSLRAPRPLVVSGLCEGAEFAFINNLRDLAAENGFHGILLVVSDEKKANRLCRWLGDCGKSAAFFALRDLVFYNASASHDFEHERLSLLLRMLGRDLDYAVTTPDALLQYTVPRARLREASFTLRAGGEVDSEVLVSRLEAGGYKRVDTVEAPGQYSGRGGIIDVFSPSAPNPVRLDLFDTEIERLCFFDVMSQRFIEDCSEVCILPARELLPDAGAKAKISSAVKQLLKKKTEGQVSDLLRKEAEYLESGVENAAIDKYVSLIYPERECLLDYAEGFLPVIVEPSACLARLEGYTDLTASQVKNMISEGSIAGRYAEFGRDASDFDDLMFGRLSVLISNMGSRLSGHRFSGLFTFRTRPTTGVKNNYGLLQEDLRAYIASGSTVKMICENESSLNNLRTMLCDSGFDAYTDAEGHEQKPGTVALTSGQSVPGFELIPTRYVCLCELGEQAVIRRGSVSHSKRRKDDNLQRILSYADLSAGDYVVHETHGIGRFAEMTSLVIDGCRKDFLKINYAGSDVLFVPCSNLSCISKYIGKGAEDGTLKLNHIGGGEWKKAKSRAKLAAKDMAKDLIRLYAERIRRPGIAFPRDDEMQREFENEFEYEETECQLRAANEVKGDMQKGCPMDRLLCGDVGYGKTEVALRAAFKAVEGGYQAAILVPTTILCMQHYRTLLSRMRGFPVQTDMVCRFRTKKEIEESLRRLRRGETDIIVGTHRLLSKDVEFRKLGLLIVDEEQRFGVTHKEKLKTLAQNVDVLTLSATPIPRTLNMAISGIRDMSILDEAPTDRQPVQTFVLEHDDLVIEEAVRRELRRGGQVFYLCNRIENMDGVAGKLAKSFPGARIEIANGQMDKEKLSDIWELMVSGEVDILVSTTIIETGVDVPNANTLIIERADKLGLSQLHQIRGRVGRSARRAYAYFTYPKNRELTEISEKRLAAIRDFTEFGSGFRIAMRDMELRGVGNLLGAEQHGHMETVGYDLYMKLLSEAVLEEKGETPPPKTECAVEMNIDAYIPEKYITNMNQRIDAYKKISLIENEEDRLDICDELIDRYGEPPQTVMNILGVSLLRARGSAAGIKKIAASGSCVAFYPEKFDAARCVKLAASGGGRVMVSTGAAPLFALRTAKKPSESISECVALLESYIALSPDKDAQRGTGSDGKT